VPFFKKEVEEMEREREILERLAEMQKLDIRFAGFDLPDVFRKWSLIWSALYLTHMDKEYEDVLGWLKDYLDGKMREEELIRKVAEMERIYEERFRQELEEAKAKAEVEEEEEKDGQAVSDELPF
jgi:hypothetical protein